MEEFLLYFENPGRIKPGTLVVSKFGMLIVNPKADPGKKSYRIWSHTTGVVVRAVEAKKWIVKRDQDDECVDAHLYMLRVIDKVTGISVNKVTKEVSLYLICTYYMFIFYCC